MTGADGRYLALATLLLGACEMPYTVRPEVHGHRGCRGMLPENTVPAFLRAAELGCDWLELDVVVTGDGQVLVSHEPWMSHRICRTPEGDSIPAGDEETYNIHRMTLAEAQAFDCGSVALPDFPEQRLEHLHKPTLREVADAVEEFIVLNGLSGVGYNVEIKSDPARYGVHQPMPQEMTRIVLEEIAALGLTDKCLIQSFDPAILEAAHALDPDLDLALLVENGMGLNANLERLSFRPEVYSPWHGLVDKTLVNAVHAMDMQLVVWTVNDANDIKRMIGLGVDGIISDHPDRVIGALDLLD